MSSVVPSFILLVTFHLLLFSGWAEQTFANSVFKLRLLDSVCVEIQNTVSSASAVYYPDEEEYLADISHWDRSSTQRSTCSVEPGNAEDIATILKIVGANKAPFAIKGGGHTANPGFSSTPGVQISMSRFSQIKYDAESVTVEVGAGLIWDDVYQELEQYGVNVVGGRVSGVGVAGFTLGGGYSFLTNQYGLAIDTVEAYELVLPTGEVVTVTEALHPDLYFALRGGLNNFGIVTKFTFKAFPQGKVWGGLITITEEHIPAVNAATANFFANNRDPKASILPTYNYLLIEPGISLILFYDAPTPPEGTFNDFLKIPHFTSEVGTKSFLEMVLSAPSNATGGNRGNFHTVSLLSYSESIMDVIMNETKFWGEKLSIFDSGVFISYDVEPFLSTLFTHGSGSAYPPDRSKGYLPLNIYYAWISTLADNVFQKAIKESAQHIANAAIADGQDIEDAAIYSNYALFDTPVTSLFGSNTKELQAIRVRYDPDGVMGLAGGFKL